MKIKVKKVLTGHKQLQNNVQNFFFFVIVFKLKTIKKIKQRKILIFSVFDFTLSVLTYTCCIIKRQKISLKMFGLGTCCTKKPYGYLLKYFTT